MKFEVTLLFSNFSEIEMSRTLLSASNDPRGGLRLWPLYFSLSVIAASTNFLPLIAEYQTEPCKVPMSSCYLLVICFLLSLPLVFELMLDVFVSMASSSAHFFKEPKIGYGLIIASLFLPVLVVNPGLEGATSLHSVLFINCFVSFLQSLVVIAQYYELQYSTSQHWTVQGSLVVLLFFVASLVCNNFGVACSPMDMIKTPWLMWFRGVALLCSLISFVLHSYLSKRYLVDFLRSKYLNKAITKAWTTDDFVAVVLQCITSIYFAINIVNCVLSLLMHNTTRHLNAVVLSHIVLGLCAAILPGRVVQKNFILLSEKMAIKDTFIRYVSHEIRSPLSTTSLGLNFLLNKLHAGDFTSSELLDVVQESVVTCELAMNTLNDFLMLDKIQSNMLEITPTTCQVSEFMVEAIRPFALQATSANVSLICNVESFDGEVGREVSVEMDCYKMNQVLRNLLSNAFKFTPSGGSITVTMTIREYSNKDLNDQTLLHAVDGRCNTVKIAVNDTGCGISAENLPKLFGQYVQFDAAKLQGGKGSGLGLWLSKAIVEMHGGRMGAKSEGEGKGCTFWFELPCGMSEMVNTNEVSQGSSFVTRSFSLSRSAVNDCDSVGGASTKAAELTKSADHDIGANSFPLIRYSSFAMPTLFSTQKPTAQAGSIGSSKIYVDLEVDIPASLRKTASKYKIALESITAADEGGDSQSFRKPLRVLLVDDSLIARKMVERSLASIEAVCSHASNGLEAVEKVRQSLKSEDDVESHIGGFDVILMDHCMPEMNGPEAVEVIRSLGYKGVIMGVSGYASTDTEFEVLLAAKKIDKMMVKPFNLNVFVDYISSSD